MDIVTKIHLLPSSDISREILDVFAEVLVRAVYPNVDMVVIATGKPSAEGVNVIQIKAPLDEATKHQLEIAFKQIFLQDFEVSFADTSAPLNRSIEIGAATILFDHNLVERFNHLFRERRSEAIAATHDEHSLMSDYDHDPFY